MEKHSMYIIYKQQFSQLLLWTFLKYLLAILQHYANRKNYEWLLQHQWESQGPTGHKQGDASQPILLSSVVIDAPELMFYWLAIYSQSEFAWSQSQLNLKKEVVGPPAGFESKEVYWFLWLTRNHFAL